MINRKIINFLKREIDKYLETKYINSNVAAKYSALNDTEYLMKFNENTKTVLDISIAEFILPDGTLKRFELDLTNFKISDNLRMNTGITSDNIHEFLNLEHYQIKYLGFDIDRLFDIGCIRIANDIENKEICLSMQLRKKLNSKIISIIEECLLITDRLVIDFFDNERNTSDWKIYSNTNTIKDIIKDMNMFILKNK